MTVPASARPFQTGLPSEHDRMIANNLRQIVEAGNQIEIQTSEGPQTLVLGKALSEVLITMLRELAEGNAITMIPISEELTTQEAADLLNVSRPFLIKLIDRKELGCRMVGRHRRLKAADVFAYKERMSAGRKSALQEIADTGADLI